MIPAGISVSSRDTPAHFRPRAELLFQAAASPADASRSAFPRGQGGTKTAQPRRPRLPTTPPSAGVVLPLSLCSPRASLRPLPRARARPERWTRGALGGARDRGRFHQLSCPQRTRLGRGPGGGEEGREERTRARLSIAASPWRLRTRGKADRSLQTGSGVALRVRHGASSGGGGNYRLSCLEEARQPGAEG